MFGFLKNLLGRSAETPDQNLASPPSVKATASPPPSSGAASLASAMPATRGSPTGKGVEVPLKAILHDLPLELQPRIRQADVGELAISVPLEKVLSQLSRGVVKITFGELRLAAPHVFAPQPDRDRVLVPLPLADVLSRLNPALIARRRVQRQIEIPPEISSPFDPQRRTLVPGAPVAKTEPAPPPAPPVPPAAPVPVPLADIPAPIPMPAARRIAPEPPSEPVIPARHTLTSTPAPVPPAAPSLPAPVLNTFSRGPVQLDAPTLEPQAAAPSTPSPAIDPNPFVVPIVALAEGWSEAIRREIVQLNLTEAHVALPSDLIERGLKQGRICFSWKALRSWVRPAPLPSVSASDSVVLELPLKVIAPLFLKRKQESAKSQQRISVDAAIPNLFSGSPESQAGLSPANPSSQRTAEPRPYRWDDAAAGAPASEPPPRFAPPPVPKAASRAPTPKEIVAQAAGFEGVSGALIALPDGLLVAGEFDDDVNAETLAAFVPQIFGKVSQCTRELRMGDLNNLSFMVGNTPWTLFRINAVFFAAYGHAGQALPTPRLAALAAELNHKPK